MTETQLPASSVPATGRTMKSVLRDAWRAVLLQDDVYRGYAGGPHAFRAGARLIFFIAVPSAIAAGLGVLLDYLTLPQYNQLQPALFTFFNGFPALTQFAAKLGVSFSNLYNFLWWLARFTGQYPSKSGVLLAPLSLLLDLLFTWWLYAFLMQTVAGWMGGKGKIEKGGFYPVMALVFAPSLLYVLNAIPGFSMPASLVQVWIVVAAFQAIRQVYGFSWGRSVLTILFTFLLNYVLLFLSVVFGVIIGVLAYSALF
jgi:hypothetical protein